MPVGDKSIPIKFFLILPILFASFCLENLTVALFGPLLGNQWQSSMLEESISTFSFLNNWRAVSSSSEFSIDSRKTLSSKHFCLEYWQLVPTKQFVASVLSWLVWRCKVLTAFSHNCAWGQMFLYLCLSRMNRTCLVFQSQSNYFILR